MAIYVIGTWDTKGPELAYIRDKISALGVAVRTLDVSTAATAPSPADVPPDQILATLPAGRAEIDRSDRGAAVSEMSIALEAFLPQQPDLEGAIGIGGSGGTALIAPALRKLPVGTPKLIVSTVASGNVAPYVGPADLTMMYSVTDLSGLNNISRRILANAAGAIAGMARVTLGAAEDKPALGFTMFGVTTPAVTAVTGRLDERFDCLVFHATGTGGQAFEKLAESGLLVGAVDLTTTEVADHLVGGVFACTSDRFGAFERSRLPYVGSCGALDMVNFGAKETVPERFSGRNLYVHNANVTLMRTTVEENRAIGRFIAERLNRCEGPVRFLLPEGGVSAIDAPGKPFHDPAADTALFDTLEQLVRQTADRRLIRVPCHINDPAFADEVVRQLRDVLSLEA